MKILIPLLVLPLAASEPLTSSANITLVPIPAGTFIIGSPDSEKGRSRDEAQRKVEITKPFHIASTEITQKQWVDVMGTTFDDLINKQRGPVGRGANLASTPSATGDEQPMCFVNWSDALEFCHTLTKKDRAANIIPSTSEYNLPSEAQWEYACRAGTSTPFHYGDTFTSDLANFYGKSPYGTTVTGPYLEKSTPVKTFKPNPWGLYDMHGNLYEWCLDWYSETPTTTQDPSGPDSGDGRIIRGGAWDRKATSCRSAYRYSRDPNRRAHNIGFRIVLIPSGE
ncbi:MAG: formylglycine-generating enzyme family protein [Verrucomicrobiaceae bacterium]